MGLFDTIRDAVGGSAEPEAEPDDDGAGESDTGDATDGPDLVEVRSLGPTTFRQQAETVVETADPLSFSPESLSRLDAAIAERYEGHEPAPGDGVYTDRAAKLGSYLGEVLVREYDGEWTRDDGWGVTVTGTNGQVTVAVFDVAAHSLTEQPVFETVPERLEAKLRFESESEGPTPEAPTATGDAESDDTASDSSPATPPDSEPTRIVRAVPTTADEQSAAADTDQDQGRVEDRGPAAEGDAAETTAGADPTRVVRRIEEPDEPTRVVQPVADAESAEPAGGDDTDEPGPPADDTAPTRVVHRIEEPDETGPLTDEPTRVVRRVDDGPPETAERPDEATAATEPPVEPTRVVRRVEEQAGDTAPTRVVRRVADAEADAASQAGPPADDTEADGPGTDPSPSEPTRVVRRVEQPSEADEAPTRAVRSVEGTGDDGTADAGSPATDDREPTRVVRRVAEDETATRAGASPASTTAETSEATSDERLPGSPATGATEPTDKTQEPPGTGPADQPGRSAGPTDDGGEEDGADAVAEDTGADTGGRVDGERDRTTDLAAEAGAGTADPGPTGDSPDRRDPATFRGLRAEYAERAVDFAEFWSERDLDFSRNSLDRLDALVGDQWADERFDDATFDSDGSFDDRVFTSVATELGSYFGEVLVRTLDGEWTDGTDHEAAVVVDGPAGPLAVPVFQVATNSLRETAVFARSYDALVADLGREP